MVVTFHINSCRKYLISVFIISSCAVLHSIANAAVSPVTVSTTQGVPITIDLTSSITNVANPDVIVDSISANGGTVSKTGSVTVVYSPPGNFVGTDSFTYTVGEDSAIISVEVGSAATTGLGNQVEDAIDGLCENNQNSALCENVADLEATAGIPLADQREVVRQLTPVEVLAQGQIGNSMAQEQTENITKRLVALRRGMVSAALGNLALVIDGKLIAGNILDDATGGGASGDGAPGNYGWFITGNLKYGEYDETQYQAGYDFYSGSLTTGVDMKLTRNWILGGALGAGVTDMTINHDEGGMDVTAGSGNLYTSYYPSDRTYLDFILSGNYQKFDNERRIIVKDLDEVATSSTNSTLAAVGIGGGVDMLISGSFTLTGTLRLDHRVTNIDGYEETGSEAAVIMSDREIQQTRSSLGLLMSIADSFSWGAMIHQFNISWEHEITDEGATLEFSYVSDPDTKIEIPIDPDDLDFYKAAYGIQFVRPGGNSGFIQIETTFGLENYYDVSLNGGYRMEF